jgi:acyl transferase domain-containing protein/acyl carrier protein/phospholipid N-methyltransferase
MSDFAERIKNLSQQQLALLALDLKSRLEQRSDASTEPLAVVGMGCRLPGAADPDAYWSLLRDGVDAISEVPADRWDIDDYYDPDPEARGRMITRYGGFIDHIDCFDHDFFGISKREADVMDPQQRILLEVAWQALEDANINPHDLRGGNSGVFVGVCNNDFFLRQSSGDIADLDMYVSTGTAHSVASGRLSYVLGLQGPAVSIDTACSSSLVAVHLACQSLRSNECRVALAGGVNLILLPEITVSLSQASMLSPDGRCKAFDQSANGFVRAEGCGMVVLKRLSHAQQDGDRIHALILGSASNQDGRSHGLTAPNGPSQEAAILAALANGKLSPDEVTLVEAHGTGTSLGDPIEARALANVFGRRDPGSDPLLVGSAKTNIGHAESAAGIAGLLKLILAARQAEVPPSLHFDKLNPHIEWDGLPISVADSLRPWETRDGRRVGSVSSFGFSGSNAHVVVANAPASEAHTDAERIAPNYRMLPVCAHTDAALRELCARYADRLEGVSDDELTDVCIAAATGRAHLGHRAAFAATSTQQIVDDLRGVAGGVEVERASVGTVEARASGQVAFLFPGQGTQYAGMGKSLYETDTAYRAAIDECARVAREHTGAALMSALYPSGSGQDSLIDKPEMTQLAIFATEYALAKMWQSWGVTPAMVIGHSIGEFAAACIAGVFSLEDGIKLVSARGRLIGRLQGDGAMAAIFADEATVMEALQPFSSQLSVAAVNGPENVVVSGERQALEVLLEAFNRRGVESRLLRVATAFHSPAVEPVLDEFESVVRSVQLKPAQIAIVSNVSGEVAAAETLMDARYWRRHLREPVRFMAGMRAAIASGQKVFLETGPHPVLIAMARAFVGDSGERWIPTLKRDQDDTENIHAALRELFIAGVAPDWSQTLGGSVRPTARLPYYPFDRERCWPDNRPSGDKGAVARGPRGGKLAARRIRSPLIDDDVFECRISASAPAYLADHKIVDRVIMPSPVYIQLAIQAATQGAPEAASRIVELGGFTVMDALPLPAQHDLIVQTVVSDGDAGKRDFRIHATDVHAGESAWKVYASGTVGLVTGTRPPVRQPSPQELRESMAEFASGEEMYASFAAAGLGFGPRFRSLKGTWKNDSEALGLLEMPRELAADKEQQYIHPALLDSCFHLLGAIAPQDESEDPFLLIGIERLRFYDTVPPALFAHARARPQNSDDVIAADMSLLGDDGTVFAEFEGIQLKRASLQEVAASGRTRDDRLWYALNWRRKGRSSVATSISEGLTPDSIRQQLRAEARELSDSNALADYETQQDSLDKCAAHYVVHALTAMNWNPREGDTVRVADLASELGIERRHARLFHRMLDILADEGLLRPDGDNYVVTTRLESSELASAFVPSAELRERCASELELLDRCGKELASALQGKVDPVTLLFPAGGFASVEALYKDAPYARTCNQLVASVVGSCLEQNSGDGRLRILEVGAGTGGTTDEVLPECDPDRTEYVYTDISPLFLERARERYADKPFIDYTMFDVEKDALQQGLHADSFDIVIAANILHATADLRSVLQNISAVLKPGGCLVAIEGTRATRWVDLTFGLTEGWWRFSDSDLRPKHALMSSTEWRQLLSTCGFEAAGMLGSEDNEPSQEVLFARLSGKSGIDADVPRHWLLAGEDSAFRGSIAKALLDAGCTVSEDTEDAANDAPAGVIFVTDRTAGADSKTAVGLASDRVLAVAQLLRDAPVDGARTPVWLATRGAQPVVSGDVDAAQAAVWGLARVVALEMPDCWGGIIDADPATDCAEAGERVALEVLHSDGEDQVGIRGDGRYVARFERHHGPQSGVPQLRAEGAAYLVTGGLGGLGLAVGQWLAANGAGHILLVSRREFPDRSNWSNDDHEQQLKDQIAAIESMEEGGATVEVCRGDVSDERFTRSIFDDQRLRGTPIRGVLHCAVAMSECAVTDLDRDVVQSMFAAKVLGTSLLDRETRDEDNDFFVLFSSTTALLGVSGLSHYAAANQFMDALAYQRRSSGFPATTINWGTWELMRIASEEDRQHFESVGLHGLNADSALACLARAIAAGEPQQIVADINWSALKPVYEARRKRPLLAGIETESVTNDVATEEHSASMADKLAQVPDAKRHDFIMEEVGNVVATVLGSSGPVSPDRGFFDMGMDSLMAVDLKSRLEKRLGCELPSTLTFNYPTIDAIAGFLIEDIFPPQSGASNEDAMDADSLSEEQLEQRLAEKLRALETQ